MNHDEILGDRGIQYLENPVCCVPGPKSEVFDSHTTAQILSFADVREPAGTMGGVGVYRFLLQKIRGWQDFAGFAYLVQQVQTLVSKFSVESRQRGDLHVRGVLMSVTAPQMRITYPIDEVDESLSFSAPEASCIGDAVLGTYE